MNILRQAARTYAYADLRVVVVTGLSNPRTCQLTESQSSLIQLSDLSPQSMIPWNFPFIPDQTPQTNVGLLSASIANGLQFLRTFNGRYQQLAEPHWSALIQSTGHLLVVTGSCGIQLLATWKGLPEVRHKIHVMALGPVGLIRPDVSLKLVQGSRDWISRACFRRVDFVINGLGHMDYWEDPRVREVVVQWLRGKISELSGPAAICPLLA